jgi:hypothetical protein
VSPSPIFSISFSSEINPLGIEWLAFLRHAHNSGFTVAWGQHCHVPLWWKIEGEWEEGGQRTRRMAHFFSISFSSEINPLASNDWHSCVTHTIMTSHWHWGNTAMSVAKKWGGVGRGGAKDKKNGTSNNIHFHRQWWPSWPHWR